MLTLHSISLVQFKNYTNRSFAFDQRIVGICGNNGAGKTNLLDAIYYLCFTRSYFTRSDGNNVQSGKDGFRLEGEFRLADKTETAVCVLRETGKKEFSVDGQSYDRFSQHIGRYPCVVIAPDDAVLITGTSEERRRFMDSLLSQIDSAYLQNLIAYTRILQQRNSLLRTLADTGSQDLSLLDVLDEQMIKPAEYIFQKRSEFFVSFLPRVKHLYDEIARQPENVTLVYESRLTHNPFAELLRSVRKRDLQTMRTGAGIHRDDLDIVLDGQSFRNIASQGQRKSLLFALKLGEMDVLKEEKGFTPLLLLDDVFEKLDEDRIGNLLQKVCGDNDGQVFITDTHEERLRDHLEGLKAGFEIVNL